jgi:hypothetical protein
MVSALERAPECDEEQGADSTFAAYEILNE